jgi:ABC-type nitrate/sulfonate/bicarbonate transport system ATPase subunit
MPGVEGRLSVAIDGKRFGTHEVLGRIHFSAEPGEVLAMLAPSGTGKTTALRVMLGLDKAFAGTVQRPAGRAGIVFQEPRLLPWLDVAGNLRLVQPDLSDSDIAFFLSLAGLPEGATRAPKALSLGMARRVAVARALATRPSLLLMDEPFASLDLQLGSRIGHDITAYARSLGAVTVIATHDLDQALIIADRVLVLGGGAPAVLVEDARCEEVAAEAFRERFGFLKAGKEAVLF